MVIKVYVSGISASTEVKKRQQRAQLILDSLKVNYENIDITEPEHEDAKEKLREVCKKRDDSPPLPPQFFNDDTYCGDWFDFELANDEDKVLAFLQIDDAVNTTGESNGYGSEDGEGATAANEVIQPQSKDLYEGMELVSETVEQYVEDAKYIVKKGVDNAESGYAATNETPNANEEISSAHCDDSEKDRTIEEIEDVVVLTKAEDETENEQESLQDENLDASKDADEDESEEIDEE